MRVSRVAILIALLAYIAGQSLILAIIPITLSEQSGSTFTGAIGLLAVSLGMLLGDFTIRRVALACGTLGAVLVGIALMLSGLAAALRVSAIPVAVVGSAIAGVGLAMAATTLLTAFASLARERQRSLQVVNAAAQRIGAMVAGLLIAGILRTQPVLDPIIATAILLAVVGAAVIVARRYAGSAWELKRTKSGSTREWRTLVQEPTVRIAMLIAGSVVFLTVVGGAVLPLAFSAGQIEHLTPQALIFREFWALLGISLLLWGRKNVVGMWLAALAVGAVGFVSALLSAAPLVIVLGSSIHGAAIGMGIVVTNVLIFEATKNHDLIAGYALNGLASRVATIATPAIFALLVVSLPVISIVVCLVVASVIAQVVYLNRKSP